MVSTYSIKATNKKKENIQMNYAQNTYVSLTRLIAIILLSLVLPACSGSGDDASTSAGDSTVTVPFVPTLSVSAEIKRLVFDWSAMPDAAYYRLYESQGGTSGFIQVGDNLTANTYNMSVAVHKFNDWRNRYYVEGCLIDDTCISYNEVSVEGLDREAIGYFKADDRERTDSYSSVALNDAGDLMVTINKGSIISYMKDSTATHGWRQGSTVLVWSNPESMATDISLSADGSRMAISSKYINWNTLAAVFLYQRSGDSWIFEIAIHPPQYYVEGVSYNENTINTVKLSGDGMTVVMGLKQEGGSGSGIDSVPTGYNNLNGAVFVYADTGSGWTKQAYIKPNHPSYMFGYDVDINMDGSAIVVSSGQDTVGLFKRTGSTWADIKEFDYANYGNLSKGDVTFGASVAMSSDATRIFVGMTNHDETTSYSDRVYLFQEYDTNLWSFGTILPTGAWNALGTSMALSRDGTTLVVGAPNDNDWDSGVLTGTPGAVVGYYETGAAVVYDVSGGIRELSYLKPSNNYEVGGTNATGFAGSQGMWHRTIDGAQYSGASTVAISDNGDTLAVLAAGELGRSFGINGDQTDYGTIYTNSNSGVIYLY